MRNISDIEIDIKELELQMEINSLKYTKLQKELYDATYVEVSWKDAEDFFVSNQNLFLNNKPHVRHYFDFKGKMILGNKEYISINKNEDGTGEEMWVGGFRHTSGLRRGEPIFIERKYANQFLK